MIDWLRRAGASRHPSVIGGDDRLLQRPRGRLSSQAAVVPGQKREKAESRKEKNPRKETIMS